MTEIWDTSELNLTVEKVDWLGALAEYSLNMPDQDEPIYAKHSRWRLDVHFFIYSIAKHWFAFLSVTVGSGLFATIGAYLQGGGKSIPLWVYGWCVSAGLVYAAFRGFCDQRRIAEVKDFELRKAKEAHGLEVEELGVEIKSLKKESANLTNRKINETILGGLHISLSNRADEIYQLHMYDFTEKYKESCEKEIIDPDTMALFNRIENFLNLEIRGASVAIFWSDDGIEHVPVDAFQAGGRKREYWVRCIEKTRHRAKQLMKIIELYIKHGEN